MGLPLPEAKKQICPTLAKGSTWQYLVKEQNVSIISTDINGISSVSYFITYFLAGWVLMHKIWPGWRARKVKYENINKWDLDSMSLASFCQVEHWYTTDATIQNVILTSRPTVEAIANVILVAGTAVAGGVRHTLRIGATRSGRTLVFKRCYFYIECCWRRAHIWVNRRLPGRRALVVVFIKNMLFEIIAFVVFECL